MRIVSAKKMAHKGADDCKQQADAETDGIYKKVHNVLAQFIVAIKTSIGILSKPETGS